jgi:hypothetical protein
MDAQQEKCKHGRAEYHDMRGRAANEVEIEIDGGVIGALSVIILVFMDFVDSTVV